MSLDRTTWAQVGALFDELADLPRDQRRARLSQIKPVEVRGWVERLLEAHDAPGESIVDRALDDVVGRMLDEESDVFRVMPDNLAGREFGSWRTIGEIGRGGMGVVMRGERADGQFEKQVAIKLLPPGPVGPERRDRFLAEIRALARLEHPKIAHLIDGGISDDGFPYLVMEIVDGVPIHTWCVRQRLGLRERIRLFGGVIEAVAFSHRHLIVHGDIKPSNILVDPDGFVKLVDFGVAAVLTEPDADRKLPAGVRCSPAYAAPERLAGAPAAIPQDIYALGAVLCELLTGRRIRDARQTTSLLLGQPASGSVQAPSALAEEVREAEFPASHLRGDLDAICARALAEDPEQRYDSVGALGADLNNWLGHRPVEAVSGGNLYRAGKWLRRHWLPAAAAGTVTATLIAGALVSQWQANRAAEAAAEAQHQARRALAAQLKAERARARAVSTRHFLVDLFRATIPNVPPDEMPDTESLLAEGARRAQEVEGLDPPLRADMLSAIGDIYHARGRHDDAYPLLDMARKVATGSRETAPRVYARAMFSWADVLTHEQKHDEAIELLEGLVEFLMRHAPDDPILLEARYEIGWNMAMSFGQDQRALDIFEEINRAVRGRDDVRNRFRRRLKTGLAHMLFGVGRYAEADPLYEEAIELEEKLNGPNHRKTAVKLANAANNDTMLGRFEQANARYQRALRIYHETSDEPYVQHAAAHIGYGSSLAWQGRIEEALAQQRAGIRKWAEYRGLESPDDFRHKNYYIASVLTEVGQWEEAEPYLERAVDDLSDAPRRNLARIYTLRALAQVKCITGNAASGHAYLDRLWADIEGPGLPPRIETAILEAEAHCQHTSGDLEAAMEALDAAAGLSDEMAPGGAGARARRSLLRARLHLEMGNRDLVLRTLDDAQQKLEDYGLESHVLVKRIQELRAQTLRDNG